MSFDYDEMMRLAETLAIAGFWNDERARDSKEVATAKLFARMLYGHELGLPPLTAVREISIFHGKPVMSANVCAALVDASTTNYYRVESSTDDACEIAFYQAAGDVKLGKVAWTMADARKAGLMGGGQWKKYPRAMLYARAMTEGVRRYCPAVTRGSVYTAEEMGEGANEDATQAQPVPEKEPAKAPAIPRRAYLLEEIPKSARALKEIGVGSKAIVKALSGATPANLPEYTTADLEAIHERLGALDAAADEPGDPGAIGEPPPTPEEAEREVVLGKIGALSRSLAGRGFSQARINEAREGKTDEQLEALPLDALIVISENLWSMGSDE